jgi:muramoyltetrapeptide carboxypeptidase LdcA involved in peptidoglycan recycling
MAQTLVLPPKLHPGDRVAVLSPSWAAPAVFPAVHETAMRRLREELGVEPVEFPTTRMSGASPRERASDLMVAFADPDIKGVMATIGGADQITVLRHLDAALVHANPKPFFGYSDNTNLLNWLWFHGLAGYHGGSTQVHLGRALRTHPVSVRSLKAALFERVDLQIEPQQEFSEDEVDWGSRDYARTPVPTRPSSPWVWHQANARIMGPTWGGNLEVLHWNLAAGRWIAPVASYEGCILLLETSEEMPSAEEVFRMLRNMGERGLLERFPAVLVACAKASSAETPRDNEGRERYREDQARAVLRAMEQYNPSALVVIGPDFGHTDPQWVLPYGGTMTVDGPTRTLVAHY